MLFHQYYFIFIFIPVSILGMYAIKLFNTRIRELSICWLSLVSIAFYGYWSLSYAWVLIASIIFNYLFAQILCRWRTSWVLGAAISINLIFLGYFKYAGFTADIAESLTGVRPWTESVILPLGISFFTFQQIAYLIDTFKNETKDHGLLEYVMFTAFFPQLIAGPIVHQAEMFPQFTRKWIGGVSYRNFSVGGTLFIIGLLKKAVIGDTFGSYADPIFAAAAAGENVAAIDAWTAMLAFTFQIYFDFSGYSDMAIGLARLFNIRLPENFRSPYKALSIIDFWRTWHMTLSRFLRNYLYYPLGGNRKGKTRRYINLMIVMLLGGLWHGAGWLFVFWGGFHGLLLCVNHLWRFMNNRRIENGRRKIRLPNTTSWALTFMAVCLSWVLFRSENMTAAKIIYSGIFDISDLFDFITRIFTSWIFVQYAPNEIIQFIWIMVAFAWVLILPSSQQFLKPFNPVLTNDVRPLASCAKIVTWRPNATYAVVFGSVFLVAAFVYGSIHAPVDFIYFEF